MYRKSLVEFVKKAWSIVEPERPYNHNWHIDVLAGLLQQVSEGKIKRLLVNVPPGTMKSLLVSVMWPAWEWASHPELRYLTASYSDHLTVRDNLKMRDIITSPWYKQLFGLALEEDQNAKTLYKNQKGGLRVATSVGGKGTGEHPDRIIIDDPLTADQARSEVERSQANDWFDQTISSRGVTRDIAIIVIMQRLHEDDLSGHLLERGGWTHLCLPMRYEARRKAKGPQLGHEPDKLDQRTVEGELLWPGLFTEKIVRQLELDLGPYGTAGQLQQRPAPIGGGLFKREWFKVVDAVPAVARRVRGWDTAGTEGGGDWTVGVRMAEAGGIFYVENVVREQLGPAGVDSLMKLTAQLDGKLIGQREEKEGGSAGKAVIAARVKTLVGYDYQGVAISGDKITRAKPYRAQVEAGNVCLVRGAWNEAYIAELCLFPNGKHDDQVDGSSCAFNAVLLEPEPVKITGEVVFLPRISPWSLGQGGKAINPAMDTGFDEE
jgi:predicted phage terminase large subunit-like protein